MAAPAATPAIVGYGATPTFQDAVAISERAVRARLIDPDSAKFEWPYNFVGGTLKALFGRTRAGFWSCGLLNSRNRMGGFAGQSWVLVMLRDGAISSIDIGESEQVDAASVTCANAMKRGLLPLAPAAAQQVTQPPAAPVTTMPPPGPMGVVVQPSPIGVLIVSVSPGSIADKAGMKPGTVISAVNGVPTKDFPPAQMITLVQTVAPTVVFSIIGASDVTIHR